MLHLVTCHFCYKKIGRVHGSRVKNAISKHWREVHPELMADITRSQGAVRDLAQKHRELCQRVGYDGLGSAMYP